MKNKVSKVIRCLLGTFLIVTVLGGAGFISRVIFPDEYGTTIDKYCDKYNVNTHLALALIKAESNFNPDAVSHAQAKGLMQLTDETYEFCKKEVSLKGDVFSPEDNICAGVWYISYLTDKFDGELNNALAAYNAGASNVAKWLKNEKFSRDGKVLSATPYRETNRYIKKIFYYEKIYSLLYPKYR